MKIKYRLFKIFCIAFGHVRHLPLRLILPSLKSCLNFYPTSNNAVYLLTIHSSKGLGYKNVFVKGIYKNSLPDYRSVDKESIELQPLIEQASPPTTMEEQRRLMYVALTRAKENLYVTYPRE
ncbi:hypothetical protein ART03_003044, partial [Listeria monocytogenes]|nr:hypothetical protein [Listeria monocytogenes]